MSDEDFYFFKKAHLEDLNELLEFGRKQEFNTYSHGYKLEDLNKYLEEVYNEARFSEYILNEENQLILIKSSSLNKIIAYILITKCSIENEKVNKDIDFLIKKLYIDENYRRIGLGSKLIQEAWQKISENCNIQYYEKKGDSNYIPPKLFVNFWNQNINAEKFYEKNNFKFVSEYGFQVGSVIDYDKLYIYNFEFEYK